MIFHYSYIRCPHWGKMDEGFRILMYHYCNFISVPNYFKIEKLKKDYMCLKKCVFPKSTLVYNKPHCNISKGNG